MGRKAKKAAKRKLEGTDTPEVLKKKEAHEELANTIKGLHWRLRKEYRANNEDHDAVWQRHSQDVGSLEKYAEAMHRLATEHWDCHGHTRVHWCRDTALEFFLKDGMKLALAKDARRRAFEEERFQQEQARAESEGKSIALDPSLTQEEDNVVKSINSSERDSGDQPRESRAKVSCPSKQPEHEDVKQISLRSELCVPSENIGHQGLSPDEEHQPNVGTTSITDQSGDVKEELSSSVVEHLPKTESSMVAENESDGVFKDEDRVPVITDPFQGKIRLLDVGSCYNPFREFTEFEPIGIDLCPATDTVFQCDFLSLTISRPLTPPALTSHLSAMSSPVTQLPSGAFHVVVFSLLLEYMPSRLQRWRCCLKAHALLAVNGLLIVVTPDSHSLHRNAPMMKSWKQAIEAVGFRRWRYEKQSHIHCMAFRKITEKVAVEEKETDKYVEMMYIPQDFKEDADEKAPKKRKTKHKVAAKSDSAQQEK